MDGKRVWNPWLEGSVTNEVEKRNRRISSCFRFYASSFFIISISGVYLRLTSAVL